MGLGSQSLAMTHLLVNDDARMTQTTSIKRLSRCHWEHLLTMQQGSNIFIHYLYKKCPLAKAPHHGLPLTAGDLQKKNDIAGNITAIGGKQYLILKATILCATLHHTAVAGDLSLAQVKQAYRLNEGFFVRYNGTGIKQSFT